MSRGGYRVGAGRPKGSKAAPKIEGDQALALDFLVAVYRNPEMPTALRLKAAIAAVPYQQARLGVPTGEVAGKKQQAMAAAAIADDPTGEWAHLN